MEIKKESKLVQKQVFHIKIWLKTPKHKIKTSPACIYQPKASVPQQTPAKLQPNKNHSLPKNPADESKLPNQLPRPQTKILAKLWHLKTKTKPINHAIIKTFLIIESTG